MDSYFQKLPVINYNGQACRDISRSARIKPNSKNQISLFHPVEVDAGFRVDNLAEAYYEDPEMDWMIWLANDIIDPYYQWYLSEREFENHILSKYGDYASAQKKIKYYRTNWQKLDENITIQHYEDVLPKEMKKYYTPVFSKNNKIISYVRKQEDWITNTNRIIKFDIDNGPFQNNEIVDIKYAGNIIGTGEVITSNTSTVFIHHVSGNTTANSSLIREIIGEESGISANTNLSNTIQINISDKEVIYWDAVSWLEWETELNEYNKNLYVINSNYALDLSEIMRLKLKE